MNKLFASVAALTLLAAPAVAADLGLGGSAGVTASSVSSSLNTHVNGNYGLKGTSMYQVGTQANTNLTMKNTTNTTSVDMTTATVSFEGVDVKGGISLPQGVGYTSGTAVGFNGAFDIGLDY